MNNTLKDNTNAYNEILLSRASCSMNSKKYYGYTQLLKANKIERKILQEEALITRLRDKLYFREEAYNKSKENKLKMIELIESDTRLYLSVL